MKRILTALVAAATLAGAAVASSAPAEARWGWGWGLGGPLSVAHWRRRTTIHTATMAITRRIPIRRPACGAMCGTATLGFAPASDRPVASAK
jgi:hypothetical protein